MTRQPDEISGNKLLICEGKEDLALVNQMAVENLIPQMDRRSIGSFQQGDGITAIRACLLGLKGVRGFLGLDSVAVLADNDFQEGNAFDYIIEQIVEANRHPDVNQRFSVPDRPLVAATENHIRVSIILMPDGQNSGCLETLLLRVLNSMYSDEMKCIDDLIACVNIEAEPKPWPQTKIEKAKVCAAVSVLHKKNPPLALSALWEQRPDLIPVSHPALSDLCQHLNAV